MINSDGKVRKAEEQLSSIRALLRATQSALDNLLVAHAYFIVKDEMIAHITD